MQLNQAEITQQNQQTYLISGVVDFSTVPGLMRSATDFFKSHDKLAVEKVNVDLSQITTCNSAGLALILEMTREAGSNNIELHFENPPESLLTIAKAYGAEEEILHT